MAQFRTTADILDLALQKAGEVTNGNSSYETQALNYLNRVHYTLIAGGTIPVGKDSTVEIDEVWSWSRARRPIVIELQPKYETGSITLTLGSEDGVFSSAPSYSVEGWYLKVSGRDEWFRIGKHVAAGTAFELDAAYTRASGSGLAFEVVKLDYDLISEYIVINSENNKLEFKKTSGGSILTATLASGTYSPSALATEVASAMTTAASGPTITGSYDSVSRYFTFTTDAAGSTTLIPQFSTGTNASVSAHRVLGFDDADIAAATTHTSTYVFCGVARLVEPFKVTTSGTSIYSVDPETLQRDFPLSGVREGVPSHFSVVRERPDGTFTVRFNGFPEEKTRVEIDHVPVPRDLKDNASSIPLVPRKFVDVLEDACVFYIMADKSDDRMQMYSSLLQGKLKAMVSSHRGSLLRSGDNFGQIVPRADQVGARRSLFGNEPY